VRAVTILTARIHSTKWCENSMKMVYKGGRDQKDVPYVRGVQTVRAVPNFMRAFLVYRLVDNCIGEIKYECPHRNFKSFDSNDLRGEMVRPPFPFCRLILRHNLPFWQGVYHFATLDGAKSQRVDFLHLPFWQFTVPDRGQDE